MEISLPQDGYSKPSARKCVTALICASLIGGLSITPAFAADRGDGHGRGEQRGHSQRAWRGDHDHNRHDYRRGYGYAQPVYAPPPVYYEPQQSPGISLFLPITLRR